jgi:dihydrofolate reductase
VREVVAAGFVSPDGVMATSDGWRLPYFDEGFGRVVGEGLATSDAPLIGRASYEEHSAYFPQQHPRENPMAMRMNDIRTYVVSTTLAEPLEWNNSTLIEENFAEEISALERQPGEDTSISGGPTLFRSLLADGLLDWLTRGAAQAVDRRIGGGAKSPAPTSRQGPVAKIKQVGSYKPMDDFINLSESAGRGLRRYRGTPHRYELAVSGGFRRAACETPAGPLPSPSDGGCRPVRVLPAVGVCSGRGAGGRGERARR